MTTATIPVDLQNPGQVFACLGLMEATEILCGPCEGSFQSARSESVATFMLSASGPLDPVVETLRFLETASVRAVAPEQKADVLSAEKWGVETLSADSSTYPFEPPGSPATLAAVLSDERGRSIQITHWGDSRAIGRDNVKFWAGAGGYPGVALLRDALDLLRRDGPKPLSAAANNPFSVALPQSSSFRFDWRRDYIPLEVGFSPNDHGKIVMVGYPIVEVLAAIGLEHARPQRPEPRDKLTYRYGVWHALLPTMFARAALGAQDLGFRLRTFRMRLGWPGQEGQARCIIDAREENRT